MKKDHCNSHFLSRRGTIAIKFVIFLGLFISIGVVAQTDRASLEAQKKAILEKIQQNQVILDQTEEKRISSLGRLKALNNQISSRSRLIGAINNEVELLNQRIEEDQEFIAQLSADLEAMKSEYAKMVYTTQKTAAGFNELTFLFAANTFNELFMRFKYMEQYGKMRKKQAVQIELVQESLNEQIAEIEEQKNDKESLLTDELQESTELQNLRARQRSLVKQLEQEESRIRAELKKQLASEKELTNMIDAIIEAERRAASLTSADMSEITTSFEQAKGRLRWPVEEGFISSKYGKHKHPTLQRVMMNNKGIDIQTPKDAFVKAVFSGKVAGVQSIQGQGITVLIQHGEFFTAYSKLKAVVVKKGDTVVEGQRLGQVLTGADNVSEVKFRINNQAATVNPEYWLQSKIN